MIAGYAAIFVILAVYLVSLVLRWRTLRRDQAALKALDAGSDHALARDHEQEG
jgi:hypothetical protein